MNKLESIMIIGPGTMGLGIAQLAAQHGHEVLLYARNLGANAAKDKLRAVLDGLVAKGKMTILAQEELLGNITPISSLSQGRDVDIVIEDQREVCSLYDVCWRWSRDCTNHRENMNPLIWWLLGGLAFVLGLQVLVYSIADFVEERKNPTVWW